MCFVSPFPHHAQALRSHRWAHPHNFRSTDSARPPDGRKRVMCVKMLSSSPWRRIGERMLSGEPRGLVDSGRVVRPRTSVGWARSGGLLHSAMSDTVPRGTAYLVAEFRLRLASIPRPKLVRGCRSPLGLVAGDVRRCRQGGRRRRTGAHALAIDQDTHIGRGASARARYSTPPSSHQGVL